VIRLERARRCYYPKRWAVINESGFTPEVTYVHGAKEARWLVRHLRSYAGYAVPQTLDKIRCQECKEAYSLACQLYLHDPDEGSYIQVEYLCGEHAAKAGYCPGCGVFIAGIGGMGVYCDNCEPEFEDGRMGAEEWMDEEAEEEWDPEYDDFGEPVPGSAEA
jgi:hypothetical protein